MSSFTAHIAFGEQDQGGIVPYYMAWLLENSRPVWLLEPTRLRLTGNERLEDYPGSRKMVRWIPEGPDHILEDGLLLVALHALGDEDLTASARKLAPELVEMEIRKSDEPEAAEAESWCDLDLLVQKNQQASGNLSRLREASSQVDWPKLVVTVLDGSSIERQVPILERYATELEVCTMSYSRSHPQGAWGPSDPGGEPVVRGSLEPRPDAPGHRYTEIRT